MELNNKDEKKGQGTPILKSVDKAFKLLDCFLGEKDEFTLNELARKLCISKGTVHRILLTAQKRGMIEHNEDTGRYQLGTKVFQLGNVVAKHMNLRRECLPFLKNISQQTGETSFLIIKDENEALCVECVEGNNLLRYQFLNVGKKMPLYVGAGPRVLLAYMDDPDIDKWLKKHKLMPWTENTITDPKMLKDEIRKVREQGYSQSIEDVTVGAAAVAAPIRGVGGEVIGTLSIAGASINFQDQKLEDYINITKNIADQLSQRMGWEP